MAGCASVASAALLNVRTWDTQVGPGYLETSKCALEVRAVLSFISRAVRRGPVYPPLGNFPRVERNPALTGVLVHSHDGPGPYSQPKR